MNIKKTNKKKVFAAVVSGLVIAVAAGAGISSGKNQKQIEQPQTESLSPVSVNKNSPAKQPVNVKTETDQLEHHSSEPSDTAEVHDHETNASQAASQDTPEPELSQNTISPDYDETEVFDEDDFSTPVFSLPCDGEIVMKYSVDVPVFDSTLEQYRTNDCISISAAEGSEVLCAANGTVEEISKTDEHGNTVTVFHSNGWRTTYGQLDEALAVEEGSIVSKGSVIGTVAPPSKYSIMLGSHVDFGVSLDNEAVDPMSVVSN